MQATALAPDAAYEIMQHYLKLMMDIMSSNCVRQAAQERVTCRHAQSETKQAAVHISVLGMSAVPEMIQGMLLVSIWTMSRYTVAAHPRIWQETCCHSCTALSC